MGRRYYRGSWQRDWGRGFPKTSRHTTHSGAQTRYGFCDPRTWEKVPVWSFRLYGVAKKSVACRGVQVSGSGYLLTKYLVQYEATVQNIYRYCWMSVSSPRLCPVSRLINEINIYSLFWIKFCFLTCNSKMSIECTTYNDIDNFIVIWTQFTLHEHSSSILIGR